MIIRNALAAINGDKTTHELSIETLLLMYAAAIREAQASGTTIGPERIHRRIISALPRYSVEYTPKLAWDAATDYADGLREIGTTLAPEVKS